MPLDNDFTKYGVYGALWCCAAIVIFILSIKKVKSKHLNQQGMSFILKHHVYDVLLGGWSFLWIIFLLLGVLYIGKPLFWW